MSESATVAMVSREEGGRSHAYWPKRVVVLLLLRVLRTPDRLQSRCTMDALGNYARNVRDRSNKGRNANRPLIPPEPINKKNIKTSSSDKVCAPKVRSFVQSFLTHFGL